MRREHKTNSTKLQARGKFSMNFKGKSLWFQDCHVAFIFYIYIYISLNIQIYIDIDIAKKKVEI